MKRVILETWEREQIFRHFSQCDYPFYSVTFPVDITNLKSAAKEQGISSYYAMIWACTASCNAIPEFRYRIVNGKLMDMEVTNPSFTVLKNDRRDFQIVTMPWEKDMAAFCRHAKENAEKQNEFLDVAAENAGLIYFSCTPWFDFTSLTNERNFDKDDMIPRIAWGQYYQEQGETMVHVSVDVNHRTIDGFHIGRFKEELERIIREI